MPHYLEDVNLSGHSLNIMHVNDLFFLQDFDGYLLAGEAVAAHHDLSKCSFAKVPTEYVITNDLAFPQVLLFWHLLAILLALVGSLNLHFLNVGVLLLEVDHGYLLAPISLVWSCLRSHSKSSGIIAFLQIFILFLISSLSASDILLELQLILQLHIVLFIKAFEHIDLPIDLSEFVLDVLAHINVLHHRLALRCLLLDSIPTFMSADSLASRHLPLGTVSLVNDRIEAIFIWVAVQAVSRSMLPSFPTLYRHAADLLRATF